MKQWTTTTCLMITLITSCNTLHISAFHGAIVPSVVLPTTIITTTTRSRQQQQQQQYWSLYSSPLYSNNPDLFEVDKQRIRKLEDEEEDRMIRDDLKRELLLLSSVTNRGEYCSKEEQNILVDIVAQLEALNPTSQPAYYCSGEWDLCLCSTQLFRSSPFFQSIRILLNDKAFTDQSFEWYDRTSASSSIRIGRIRQIIMGNQFQNSVDIQMGIPFVPFRMEGTIQTIATMKVKGEHMAELQYETTQIKVFNIPTVFNEYLDKLQQQQWNLPLRDLYSTWNNGPVPIVPMKTYYVDETMRIARDIDDNFFVFTRA